MNSALAQTARPYRLVLLRNASGNPVDVGAVGPILAPTDIGNRFGINNKGVVVGVFEYAADPQVFHGFVWFPNNLGVSGMHFDLRQLLDIHAHAPTWGSTSDSTLVNDAASDKVMVGFKGPGVGHDGEAYAFTLNLTAATIGAVSLQTEDGPFSTAFGVNDATTTGIVGVTTADCPDLGDDLAFEAYYTTWTPSGGAGTMVLLPTESTASASRAADIARTGTTLRICGDDNGCEEDTDPCTIDVGCGNTCLKETLGALRWSGTSSVSVLDGIETADSGVNGRGINSDDDVGGWGWADPPAGGDPELPCPKRSAFWNGSSQSSHRPGDTMPGNSGHASWAEAISPRDGEGCVTLVGMDLDAEAALVWHGFDDSWCVEDLNQITRGIPANVALTRAFDINQYRHVTVFAENSYSNEFYAGVLTSAADFNGDLKVNGTDRSMLVAHYCSSGCSAAQLEYDLDEDGDVDAADLSILLGTYYSGSSLATVPAICSCSQESFAQQSAASESAAFPLTAETALASLGFGSWQGLSDWLITADEATADTVCDTLAFLLHGE